MSKHEDIIKYIISLKTGSKISVRTIASELNVSEGTAYRAIKESDALGLVSTIPRVGTVRVEKVEKKSIEALTYAEVVNIIQGTILGGKDGLYKTLNKFVIGAMTVDAMEKYISPGCLLIVGNREEAYRMALSQESAVLITGGFTCSEEIKKLANEKHLPIISSAYDTFTIATMINKAISESLIKKDIIYVEDIMHMEPLFLKINDTVGTWSQIQHDTGLRCLPVIDVSERVVGMVSHKDLPLEIDNDEMITSVMSKEIITVTPKTTVAYTAHIMGWEDIEVCPVVDGKRLIGIVTREDVIKVLQYAVRQPQSGESFEDLILKNFQNENLGDSLHFWGKIISEMLDPIGTASWSSLNMLMSTLGIVNIRHRNNLNISVDSFATYFIKPLQMDSLVDIYTRTLDMGRNFCKVEIEMYDQNKELVAKALMSAKILRK